MKKIATLVVIFLLVASFFSVFAEFVAPVLAATGSFGHLELGSTIGYNGLSGVYVSAFQAPNEANNKVMTEVVCAIQTISGSGSVVPVVYAADGASNRYASRDPSTLLSTGSPVVIGPTMEWSHMSLSTQLTIQGGTTYYLGYLSDVGTFPSQDYRSPPSTPTSIYEMELAGCWLSYPNPPSKFGRVTYVHAGANILAVYAVYTTDNQPPPPEDSDGYSLTMYTVGNGTVTPGNSTGYHLNDVVNLQATPNSGWSFQTWTNATGGARTPVTIIGNTVVTATFIESPVLPSTGSFGHVELGSTKGYMGIPGVYMTMFKAPAEANGGVMTEVVCAVSTISSSGFMVPVVYADDGALNQYGFKTPGTLLATGSPVTIDTAIDWRHMILSTYVTIQGGKNYFLGYLANVGTYCSQDYTTMQPTSMYQWIISGGYGTYPNPLGYFSTTTRFKPNSVSILATYTTYTIGGG